ncbi:fibronectin type III domain-containing protein, partial [Candidatus Woesearchaeota archaeon]|nr:fibronectin type III domain-containing protein [Candidatus Woesearchaeota archaeon]
MKVLSMMGRAFVILLIASALLEACYALLWTGAIAPAEASICGEYSQSLDVIALNIYNSGAEDIENAYASLVLPDDSGLSLLTEKNVLLGNISSMSKSSIDPEWTVVCLNQGTGNHIIYAEYNYSGGSSSSLEQGVFSSITVYNDTDRNPPIVLSSQPEILVTEEVTTLVIETDEDAYCRYDLADKDYDNMTVDFITTGSIVHRRSVGPLESSEYSYYIRCIDKKGNAMSESSVVRFKVELPPTAKIAFSKEPPLREGLAEITLTTSKSVKPIPVLEYSIDGSAFKEIPLTGSGTQWKGYLFISAGDNSTVGVFRFSAEDFSAITGTKITEGNLFLIDTTAPSAPQFLLTKVVDEDCIKLSWFYDDETPEEFRIYRSESEIFNYSESYRKTDNNYFLDEMVEKNVTYYYRVAAVDKAGNIGALSDSVSFRLEKTPKEEPVQNNEQSQIDESRLKKIQEAKDFVEELMDEIDRAYRNLANVDQEIGEIATAIGLYTEMNNSKIRLISLRGEYEKLKESKISWQEFDKELRNMDIRRKTVENGIVAKMVLKDKQHYFNKVDSSDVLVAMQKISSLYRLDLSENELKKLVRESKSLDEKVSVITDVYILELETLDGSMKRIAVVKKEIFSNVPGTMNELRLVEFIPKDMAIDANDIRFSSSAKPT